jgi:hypothetical protein
LHQEMGANLRECLALAYPLDAVGVAGPQGGRGIRAADLVRDYRNAADLLERAIVETLQLGLSRAEAGSVGDVYQRTVSLTPEVAGAMGPQWARFAQLTLMLAKAVADDPTWKKRVDRYAALTGPLLRWKAELAAVAARTVANVYAGGVKMQVDDKFLLRNRGPAGAQAPVAGFEVAAHAAHGSGIDPDKVRGEYVGQLVSVPHMRFVEDDKGQFVLKSRWLGRALFVAPVTADTVAQLKAAQVTLGESLRTGSLDKPLTVEAALALGLTKAGPFPAVVARVEKIETAAVTYALAHMSDAHTVMGDAVGYRPGNLMTDRFFVFHLKPVCIQTPADVVKP